MSKSNLNGSCENIFGGVFFMMSFQSEEYFNYFEVLLVSEIKSQFGSHLEIFLNFSNITPIKKSHTNKKINSSVWQQLRDACWMRVKNNWTKNKIMRVTDNQTDKFQSLSFKGFLCDQTYKYEGNYIKYKYIKMIYVNFNLLCCVLQ